MVLIHRWSLCTGSITWKIYSWEPVKCGLYKQVILYIQVVFREGLSAYATCNLIIFRLMFTPEHK